MKKILITMLVILSMIGNVANAVPNTVKVIINGNILKTDTPAVIRNSRTMVPFRALFEALGANNITWDEPTQTVTGSDGITSIKLVIGSYDLSVNGKNITMDTPPMIINSRTMIPLSAVSYAMGAKVDWNAKEYIATVTKNVSQNPTNEDINNSVMPIFTDILNTPENTQTLNPISNPKKEFANVDTSDNKTVLGYYAMQDLKRNKFMLNLKQDNTANIVNINTKEEKIGSYYFSNNSLTLNILGFNNVYEREDVHYNGKNLILMKEKNNPTSGSTFVLLKVTQTEYDKYTKK